VPPIGRHGGQPQIEEVAFNLQDGEISGVTQVADKWVILLCEGRTVRMDIDLESVREELYRDIHEKKLRIAMGQKFEEINSQARVDNYLAGTSHQPDKPNRSAQQPVREDTAVRPTAAVR
jgi:parvulin-like peptidyl-prolyl isomerase